MCFFIERFGTCEGESAHVGQIDQIDKIDQIDHLDHNLPLLHVVQDLQSTYPTEETCRWISKIIRLPPDNKS